MTPHLAAIDRAITDMIAGRTERILLIEAPPRHGKSELISRYLPAWYLGRFPDRRVILTGYSMGFARMWGRKARDHLLECGARFEAQVDRGVRASNEWGLRGHEGTMTTAGMGGSLTGRGADLLIIDDPIKNSAEAQSQTIRDKHWDWWQTTASTRIEPGGCAVIIATRWNDDDLSGRLIQAAANGTGQPINRLRFPAIAEENDPLGRAVGQALWPQRWPIESLLAMREGKEEHWWQAMYQQRPSRNPGRLWPDAYFEPHLWTESFPQAFDLSALAIDPAKGTPGGDDSAIVFVGLSGGTYWVDASLSVRPPEATVADAIDMAIRYCPHAVAIESNLFQALLAPEFDRMCRERRLPPLPLYLIEQQVPKRTRIERLGPWLLRRQIRLRRTEGCESLVRQLRAFPSRERDDGPDALELAIRMIFQLAARKHAGADFTIEFGTP